MALMAIDAVQCIKC